MILLSVITVVRNDPTGLERTIASVAEQTWPAIEYIVVDGASTDGTLEVIHRHQERISRWVSEADGGIYGAMNKGVRMATGQYVIFMNAADRFYGADTAARMLDGNPQAELLWGDCVIEKADGSEEYDRAGNVLGRLHRQMTVSHQSLFTRTEALRRRPYDEGLRIAADYDFLCERLLAGASWEYRPIPVSRINDHGASTVGFERGIAEKKRIALARFKRKRWAIYLHYGILLLYMRLKSALGGIRGR